MYEGAVHGVFVFSFQQELVKPGLFSSWEGNKRRRRLQSCVVAAARVAAAVGK